MISERERLTHKESFLLFDIRSTYLFNNIICNLYMFFVESIKNISINILLK